MQYLDNAYNTLLANLDDQWTVSLSDAIDPILGLEENVRALELVLSSKLEPILANVFDDLNKSLIDGEYSTDLDATTQKLQDIDGYITTQADIDIAGLVELTRASQAIYSERFLNPLREGIKDFKRLVEFVRRRLNFEPLVNTLFHVYRRNDIVSEIYSSKYLKLFKLNLQVSFIDHGFSFENETFRKLIVAAHTLTEVAGVGSVSDILKKKCDFLVNKLTHRLDNEKTNRYAIDFQYHSVNTGNAPEFDYYDEIIKGHYDDVPTEKFKHRYKDALKKFEQSPENLSFDEYHALIKYYKDVKPSLKKINALKSTYESFYQNPSSVSDFDKKSRELLYCYIENNILSLELEQQKFTLDNWDERFEKYIEKANGFKNSNFFPYFKIIDQFLKKEVQDQFTSENLDIDVIDNLLAAYELNLNKFSENLQICQEANYLTFQLDFDSCKTQVADVNGINWQCFIASSFVLPIDYTYWSKVVDAHRNELLKLRTLRDLHSSIKKDVKEIYKIKDKLEESDKRHIEILSIFAAIVMFVSSEVQMFTRINNVKDAVIFTLFFAFSLGLFVLLIWFVTRPLSLKLKKLPATHYALIVFFIISFLGSTGFILFYPDRKKQTQAESSISTLKEQITLDSLKREHKKYSPK